MKTVLYNLALLGVLLLCPMLAQANDNDSLKILWIGNSYTYYNNLPALVTKLAAEQGLKLSPTRFLKGGAHLSGHYKNQKLIEALEKGGWDYIVMQEHSSSPAQSTREVVADTYYYAHLLDSLAKKGSPKAQVIYYMTWGHKNGNMQNSVTFCRLLAKLQNISTIENPKITSSFRKLNEILFA